MLRLELGGLQQRRTAALKNRFSWAWTPSELNICLLIYSVAFWHVFSFGGWVLGFWNLTRTHDAREFATPADSSLHISALFLDSPIR